MDYDIGKAIAAIEEELIASMMRNMERHREWETDEGFQWSMWQAEQLKALDKYKRTNKKKFERQFNEINGSIRTLIERAREQGGMEQELEILEAIGNGWKPKRFSKNQMDISGEFFKLNTRKLEALIKATEKDFQRAEVAMLRMADDQYRQVIFNAQVYANTGAGTYEQAVDMATKDFMSRGINCIEYANGARHTMRDYAEMAIRTAAKRAYLAGEGEKRQEWGIDTVIVNKRGNPCPKCLPFVGKVLIDDVWSGGSSAEGQKYPLMSTAVAAGLYHPNCKDAHSTYFEGISEAPDDVFTEEDIEQIEKEYTLEQKKNVAKRNYEKYSRMEEHALDEENRTKYAARKAEWLQKYQSYYQQGTNSRRDVEQFGRYRNVLQELSPGTIEEFTDIKYNDSVKYKDLKQKYRILNQYKIDSGSLTPTEVLNMDWDIIRDKRNNFISDYKKSGNIAGVRVDGEKHYLIAHSNIADPSNGYKGENVLVGLKDKRHYNYIDVPKSDGTLRKDTFHDTEAKLFEYLAELYKEKPFKRIDMLSERGMCDSCLGVMEQFCKEHPDVIVNAVSNKKVEGNVWKRRLKNKNKKR
jgi:hypothetical protein